MLILNITYVPLEIFWDEESLKDDMAIIFDIIPTIFCIFEICFRFITSYYNEGIYILNIIGILYNNKTKIIEHYFKTDFTLDFLSIFPIFYSNYII